MKNAAINRHATNFMYYFNRMHDNECYKNISNVVIISKRYGARGSGATRIDDRRCIGNDRQRRAGAREE